MKKILLSLSLILILAVWSFSQHDPILFDDFYINEEPLQVDYIEPKLLKKDGNYSIYAVADFKLKARILSVEKYNFGKDSEFSPIDIVAGWKQMSKKDLLDKVKISQATRFYFWYADRQTYQSYKEIISSQSANMHLVPSSDEIDKQIKKLKKNHAVIITGKLIVINDKNWRWQTSTSRYDTGNGACEIIWVEQVQILN